MKPASIDLQEQLLILLTFHEREAAAVEALVPAEMFEGHYQIIAQRLLKYRKKYEECPGTGLFSIFSDLQGSEAWDTYRDALTRITEHRGAIAPKFVLDQVTGFIKRQKLKQTVLDAYEKLQESDDDNAIYEVETMLKEAPLERAGGMFDAGMSLREAGMVFSRREEEEDDVLLTGIDQIDDQGLGPARGQLSLLVAPSKTGKSWWGVHLTKMAAAVCRKSVLFITLEIRTEEVMRRVLSSMFAIRRVKHVPKVTRFKKDTLGRVVSTQIEEGHTGLYVGDDNFHESMTAKLKLWADRAKIIVKEFPSGVLTIPMLEAYLTHLAVKEGFRPDLVVLDYADLMKLSSDNLRIELERLFVSLRGLAQQRNFALVTMSQANREGAKSKGVSVHHVAEAWAKIATADTVFTLSRSPDEDKRGLARLRVAASRVGQDGFTVTLSQDYAHGQFVIDQARVLDLDAINKEGA